MSQSRITSSPVRPWRVDDPSTKSSGTTHLIQSNRLDVLAHLLAFEQLAGVDSTFAGGSTGDTDWLARSEEFSSQDNEVGVAELAAELLTSSTCDLRVSFASGGQLVRGATSAAAALYSGAPYTRVEAADKVLDRSYDVLAADGWAPNELCGLLSCWSRIDDDAAVVLVDLDAAGSAELEYELCCRYAVLANTINFLSDAERNQLSAIGSGSVRVMYLRAGGPIFAQVLDSHRTAISLTRRGTSVQTVLDAFYNQERSNSTSAAHQQRLRRIRRVSRRDQLLARALGR